MTGLQIVAVPGIPEVEAGDDLAEHIVANLGQPLVTGDIVVVTSKVVSKAAGLVVRGSRADLLATQTDRVVARRGPTQIVRTLHGLTLAAAGIDASNTAPDTAVLLPTDSDASARTLRATLRKRTGATVGVVVTDTAGRPWRDGQTDIAIGLAGVAPLLSLEGALDAFGNPLVVTAPAIADEIAAATDLVKQKLAQTPVAVVHGAPDAWLLEGDGPGAAALIRGESADLFGLGAADAVLAAVARESLPVRGFPAAEPDAAARVVELARTDVDPRLASVAVEDGLLVVRALADAPASWAEAGRLVERLRTLAVALSADVTVVDPLGAADLRAVD